MKAATRVFSQYEEPNASAPSKNGRLAYHSMFSVERKSPMYKQRPRQNMTDATFTEEEATATLACFYSGPAFMHLPLHFKYVHMHVLNFEMRLFQHKTCQTFVLGWFCCSGDASEFSFVCARWTQQEIQFSKTKKLQCCSDCSRKLNLEDNQTVIYVTDLTAKNHNAEHFK